MRPVFITIHVGSALLQAGITLWHVDQVVTGDPPLSWVCWPLAIWSSCWAFFSLDCIGSLLRARREAA